MTRRRKGSIVWASVYFTAFLVLMTAVGIGLAEHPAGWEWLWYASGAVGMFAGFLDEVRAIVRHEVGRAQLLARFHERYPT